MTNHQRIADHEIPLAARADREAPRSPSDGEPCPNRQETNESAFAGPASFPDEFFQVVTARLVRCAMKLGLPKDQSEDLAQAAWLIALNRSERFRSEHTSGRFCAWLSVVVHNLAIDALRHRDSLPVDSLQALRVEVVDEREAELRESANWCERLAVWLARLQQEESENYRLVCERHLKGRTVQELVHEAGWTANEVSCRIYRALEKIRSWASEDALDGEDCRHE